MPYEQEALAILTAYLKKLELGDKATYLILAKQWGAIRDDLMVMIDKLVEMEIKSPDQLYKLALYKKFKEQAEYEIARYSKVAGNVIADQQLIYGKAAIECTQQIISLQVRFFEKLPIDAINVFIGRSIFDNSPLHEVINRISPHFAERVKEKLLLGFSRGYDPRKIARLIRTEDMDISLWKALQVSRTESLMAWRTASQMSMEKSGVVPYKQRIEQGDACPECQEVNGKITKVSENGGPWHPNCRGTEIAYFGD